VHWLERLLEPGAVVLGPFCGSGTTGVACLRVGLLTFIGCEVDKESAHISRARIAEEAKRLKTVECRVASTCVGVKVNRTA
jgi:site-specific DNA-methyltransferase (adenine-specific)